MRVGSVFMTLISDGMTWKSASSSGWKYMKGHGFKSYVSHYVLFDLLLILILYIVVLGDNMIVKVCELAWNMNWLGGLALTWHWS